MSKKIELQGKTKVVPIEDVIPYWRNPRRIPEEAVEAVRTSIEKYGYQQPIVVDKDMVVVVGHTRLQALQHLGYTEVEVSVTDLPEDKVREYRIVDNKVAEMSSWDPDALMLELREFEQGLLEQFFPHIDLEIALVNHEATTATQVESGARQALTLKESVAPALVEVECPSCFHRFSVKATALPGVRAADLADQTG